MRTFRDFCKSQIGRFAGRQGWPSPSEHPEAVRDLIEALERASKGSQDMAIRITDTCVAASRFCPTVPDILQVGIELRDKDNNGPKFGFKGCAKCDFTGWIHGEKNGYDFSAACVCQKQQPKPPTDDRMRRAAGERELSGKM